jgi:hypothetical protein
MIERDDAPEVIAPTCPNCGRTALTKRTQYGARHSCCGMHSWRGKPLVDQETHDLRRQAHALVDPIWQGRGMTRGEVYRALAEALGIPPIECHISMMGPDRLQQVLKHAPSIAAHAQARVEHKQAVPRCQCGNLSSPKRIQRTGDKRCRSCIRVEELLVASSLGPLDRKPDSHNKG